MDSTLTFAILIPVDGKVPKSLLTRCLSSISEAINDTHQKYDGIEFSIDYGCPENYVLDDRPFRIRATERIITLDRNNIPDRVNHLRQSLDLHNIYKTYFTFIDADDEISDNYFSKIIEENIGKFVSQLPSLVDVHPYRRRGRTIFQKSYLDNFSLVTKGEEILDYPGPGITLWGRFFKFPWKSDFKEDLSKLQDTPTHGWGEEQALLQLILQYTIRDSAYCPDASYYWHYPDTEVSYTPLSRQVDVHEVVRNIEVAREYSENPKLFSLMMVDRLFKSLNLKYKNPDDLNRFQRDLYYVSAHFKLDRDEIVLPDEEWMNPYDKYSVEVITGQKPLTNEERLPFLEEDLTLVRTFEV